MDIVRSKKKTIAKYFNRDLSWLEFNRRVLEEAQDHNTPLLERVKFLSIVSTNLDEFMSVRVAGIMDQIKAGLSKRDFSGYTPEGLLKRIAKKVQKMVAEQYQCFQNIAMELAKEGIIFRHYDELNHEQKKELEQYYYDQVFPVLTPMAIDESRPFPFVRNKGLYLAIVLRPKKETDDEKAPYLAILQIPTNLTRYIKLPTNTKENAQEFILLEELIQAHISSLFTDYSPLAVHTFRLTRNADLTLNEEEAEDLLEEIQRELRLRRWGSPVRLEMENGFHSYALQVIKEELDIENNIFTLDGPIDLSFLIKFSNSLKGFEHLRYPKNEPVYPIEFVKTDSFFSVLRQQDVLLFHPYESFDAINDFIYHAALDPSVLAIKMTLYRVSGGSRIVHSLALAAESGKQVTVVVEIKARFDEERNIAWAKALEKAGCHVVYGLVGLKTHAKMTMVVRQEDQNLKRYVHVSTGNYNGNTARLYTDIGLFTSDPKISEDISILFNEITGFSNPRQWNALSVAPTDLKQNLFRFIQREMENAASGKKARIVAKMNSLSNQEMVDQLYLASQAGVKIDLIVRGICCLRPRIDGLSEHITVRSIVDRYLEHSRIFYFENGGYPQVWLSSADWMTRNLTRRIELICPVLDERLKEMVIQYLSLLLNDNVKARQLLSNGKYIRVKNEQDTCRSQFEMQNHIKDWKVAGKSFEYSHPY